MISFGPFPIEVFIVLVAVVLTWWLAQFFARGIPEVSHKAAGQLILDSLLWGLLAARLGYIAQWWNEYGKEPLSMIAIGDGGFSWWVGVLIVLAFTWWRTRSIRMLRRPVLVSIFAGVAAWLAAGGLLDLARHAAPLLPDIPLITLDARPIALNAYIGRPVVLNIWASWCPPCRLEMPAFEKAQSTFPHIAFVMVNQGESEQQVRAFLEREGLKLSDVLLDPSSKALQAVGASGLPTTLFFDPQGHLVDSHMGELTIASLKNTISRRFAQSSQQSTNKE